MDVARATLWKDKHEEGGFELSTLEFNPGPRDAGQVHSPELQLLHL